MRGLVSPAGRQWKAGLERVSSPELAQSGADSDTRRQGQRPGGMLQVGEAGDDDDEPPRAAAHRCKSVIEGRVSPRPCRAVQADESR